MRVGRTWIGAVIAGTTLIGAVNARGQEPPPQARRTLSVTGQGEVTAAPDRAVLALAVETTAAKADEAAQQNAERSATVAAAIKTLLGKTDKLTTTRYGLEPRYEPAKRAGTELPNIIGYVARNEVQVETAAITSVGGLIDAAIAAGANRVSNLQFTLSHRDEQLRAALQQAGAEARAQADAVAAALGVTLKRVVSATTTAPPIVLPQRMQAYGMAAMAAPPPPTPLEPGEVTVSATLQVTYEIE